MNTYRVAISGDMLKPDGTLAYPMVDLSPLTENPDVELAYLPNRRVIASGDIQGYDALAISVLKCSGWPNPSI